jgi:hypothetical protein
VSGREVVFARHLGEEEESATERYTDGGEAGDDAWSGEGVGVGEVGPGGDGVGAGGVLEGDGVA